MELSGAATKINFQYLEVHIVLNGHSILNGHIIYSTVMYSTVIYLLVALTLRKLRKG